jgi:hypothetical protein
MDHMNADHKTGSDPARARTERDDARPGTLTRRQAITRIGTRGAAIGVAAWVVPEILVGTPTAAGALSLPPGGGRGDGGGDGGGGDANQGAGGGVDPGTGGAGGLIVGGWLLHKWGQVVERRDRLSAARRRA